MNNSYIAQKNIDFGSEQPDTSPMLRQRETELVAIMDAVKHIQTSKYWQVCVDKIFKPDFDKLGDKLRKEKNPTEMYRLQGKLSELEKVINFTKIYEIYYQELQSIRSNFKDAETD